jgi:hypothetical protein
MNQTVQITTPIGTLMWPWLTAPDTRFNPEGTYSTKIVIAAGEAADALEAKMLQFKAEAVTFHTKEAGGKKVKVRVENPFERDEHNNLVLSPKLKANVTTKSGKSWTQRPALFDSKGQKVSGEIRIGSGTRAKLALELGHFNQPGIGGVGISLRLRGVQLIEIRESAPTRAEDFGFGAEEIGFVAETFDNFEDDAPKQSVGGPSKKATDF